MMVIRIAGFDLGGHYWPFSPYNKITDHKRASSKLDVPIFFDDFEHFLVALLNQTVFHKLHTPYLFGELF